MDVRESFSDIDGIRKPKDSFIVNFDSIENLDQHRDLNLFHKG